MKLPTWQPGLGSRSLVMMPSEPSPDVGGHRHVQPQYLCAAFHAVNASFILPARVRLSKMFGSHAFPALTKFASAVLGSGPGGGVGVGAGEPIGVKNVASPFSDSSHLKSATLW